MKYAVRANPNPATRGARARSERKPRTPPTDASQAAGRIGGGRSGGGDGSGGGRAESGGCSGAEGGGGCKAEGGGSGGTEGGNGGGAAGGSGGGGAEGGAASQSLAHRHECGISLSCSDRIARRPR